MTGITDDQGTMCFLDLVAAIRISSVDGHLIETTDLRCVCKPIINTFLLVTILVVHILLL